MVESVDGEDVMSGKKPSILVVGLGGAGCATVNRMAGCAPVDMEIVAMDCDFQTLETCTQVETKMALGNGVTDGLSAGGDMEMGRRCAEKSSEQIESMLSGVDLLMVVAGLGGGFAGGAAPVLARMARSVGAHTLFFTVFPFAFEGGVVRGKAHNSLRRLRTHADAIVQMSNSRIQPEGDALFTDSLERSDRTLAAGVAGIWRLLMRPAVCNLDFASLHTMLHYCDATCRFSCASASGEHRAEELVQSLREHPLAQSGDVFENAPGLIIGISGGDDLTLAEVQAITEAVSPQNEECWVKLGVSIDPAFNGKVSAMILAAEAWKEPLIDNGLGGLKSASGQARQTELAGVLRPRSQAFGGSERTIWHGEDLDIPTYLRRKVKLPR
jgi:cell division protein FtsZ